MSINRPDIARTTTIASILRDEILSGRYRTGERLPSERDLSERFQASRSAVREALKQLQQLGIADIQPGGARVAPIEECTLDVLGPLLDLHAVPDPKLVDEVLHMTGVLVREAASVAVQKATDQEIEAVEAIIDDILRSSGNPAIQFEAVRRLAEFYVNVADHLVLRLMVNGLRTSFMERMDHQDLMAGVDPDSVSATILRIRKALGERNAEDLGDAMQSLNRLFRDGARTVLHRDTPVSTGIPA